MASVTVAQRGALGYGDNHVFRRLKTCFTRIECEAGFQPAGLCDPPNPRALPEATVNKAHGLNIQIPPFRFYCRSLHPLQWLDAEQFESGVECDQCAVAEQQAAGADVGFIDRNFLGVVKATELAGQFIKIGAEQVRT